MKAAKNGSLVMEAVKNVEKLFDLKINPVSQA